MGVQAQASVLHLQLATLRSMMAMCTSPAKEEEDSQGRVRPGQAGPASLQTCAPALKGTRRDKNRMRWSSAQRPIYAVEKCSDRALGVGGVTLQDPALQGAL